MTLTEFEMLRWRSDGVRGIEMTPPSSSWHLDDLDRIWNIEMSLCCISDNSWHLDDLDRTRKIEMTLWWSSWYQVRYSWVVRGCRISDSLWHLDDLDRIRNADMTLWWSSWYWDDSFIKFVIFRWYQQKFLILRWRSDGVRGIEMTHPSSLWQMGSAQTPYEWQFVIFRWHQQEFLMLRWRSDGVRGIQMTHPSRSWHVSDSSWYLDGIN